MTRKTKDKILSLIKRGEFRYSYHAFSKTTERGFTENHIENIARTCTSFVLQENGTYKVVGKAFDNISATLICKLVEVNGSYVLIVTLY